ncbi:signal peptidase [Chryseobacterium oryctis]|uniref:Signal peptidase n=1 Tax=Chryseobacterium oryctis TaxID=2952618 RepID=A0ABT3HQA0_9FLAO|nr:signal peptidase [Chryseobacterium oryctis]MCW3161929.1 signal peptidase [Chryseobacterium oryctis]
MKTINKLVLSLFLFIATLGYADTPVLPPPGEDDGGGTTGPGVPASPIDMYIIGLAIVAIMLTVFFAKKYKAQKI